MGGIDCLLIPFLIAFTLAFALRSNWHKSDQVTGDTEALRASKAVPAAVLSDGSCCSSSSWALAAAAVIRVS
jgi:hypothetical protein